MKITVKGGAGGLKHDTVPEPGVFILQAETALEISLKRLQ